MVKYVSTYSKGTLINKKDQRRTYQMMLMRCFYVAFFVLFIFIFFREAYVVITHLNCIDKSMQFKWVP